MRTQPAPPPRHVRRPPTPSRRPALLGWALLAAAAAACLVNLEPDMLREPAGEAPSLVVESTVHAVHALPTPIVVAAKPMTEAEPVVATLVDTPPRARVRRARAVQQPATVDKHVPASHDVLAASAPPPPPPVVASPKPRKGLFKKLRSKRRKGV